MVAMQQSRLQTQRALFLAMPLVESALLLSKGLYITEKWCNRSVKTIF